MRRRSPIVLLEEPPINPTPQPQTVYTDGWGARWAIALFTRQIAAVAGATVSEGGYAGFVAVSRQLMRGRNPAQQQAVVGQVLRSLVPSPLRWLVRTGARPTRWVCETNAWFATVLFPWLVGPLQRVPVPSGEETEQRGVKIQRCRYLEASGCVGACVNLCKMPTQKFFAEELGIPLTMTPNFADLSCEMVFGQVPPPVTEEAAWQQPCLDGRSPLPCPQVRGG
ncbi:MAG: DUF4033 domain-containing protein [Oscillatoriales cyanobacterium SM2_1_8]|nr:DUF4033 domain-containing protein [Oscillatoriales cyanobacterium SM2_1_8]